MCRITPHFVDLFVVSTSSARRTSLLTQILASLLGDDGHLHHHGGLVVELVHQLPKSSCSCSWASNLDRPLSLRNWHDVFSKVF